MRTASTCRQEYRSADGVSGPCRGSNGGRVQRLRLSRWFVFSMVVITVTVCPAYAAPKFTVKAVGATDEIRAVQGLRFGDVRRRSHEANRLLSMDSKNSFVSVLKVAIPAESRVAFSLRRTLMNQRPVRRGLSASRRDLMFVRSMRNTIAELLACAISGTPYPRHRGWYAQ